MTVEREKIKRASEELAQIRSELCQLEKRVDSFRISLREAMAEAFGSENQSRPPVEAAVLASKIAELVLSQLLVAPSVPSHHKHYVREREAAEYIGVKVSTLRAWRSLRSKHGPPFVHVGRMVMYPVKALEEHMQQSIVPRRG